MSAAPYALTFFAPGVPATKGSLDAIPVRGSRGKTYMRAGNQGAQDRWTSAVRSAARDYPDPPDEFPYAGPVEVICQFVLPITERRKSVTDYQAGDLDKLERCVWDALTGVVYVDDVQVTVSGASKRMAAPGEMSGATINVRLLGDGDIDKGREMIDLPEFDEIDEGEMSLDEARELARNWTGGDPTDVPTVLRVLLRALDGTAGEV